MLSKGPTRQEQKKSTNYNPIDACNPSILNTKESKIRILKFFELLIEIDKSINKRGK